MAQNGYKNVHVSPEMHRLAKEIALATNKSIADVVARGIRLMQAKHQVPDPPKE